MKKSNQKGFTIVELVIVIAVIAILAAVLIPTFSGIIENAKISAAEQTAIITRDTLLADGKFVNDGNELEGTIFVQDGSEYVFVVKDGKLQRLAQDTNGKADFTGITLPAAVGASDPEVKAFVGAGAAANLVNDFLAVHGFDTFTVNNGDAVKDLDKNCFAIYNMQIGTVNIAE